MAHKIPSTSLSPMKLLYTQYQEYWSECLVLAVIEFDFEQIPLLLEEEDLERLLSCALALL